MTESLGLPDGGRGGALAGVVIVELAETLAGEQAGGLLADLGATVIKIEPPGGSPMRRRGPGVAGEDSLAFQTENRGKHSVRAELAELGTEPWLARLLAAADALVEDLGPGRLEAAGLSPDALERRNPRLVTLRISPFGQTGPLAGERGDDRIAQAFSGVQFVSGFPDRAPMPVTVPLAESWTAIHGASGLLIAMFHARRSGRGQVVDLGLYQTGLRMQEEVVVRHDRTGAVAARLGTESPIVVPANVYRTRDGGWIAVSGAGDQPFARLCEAIEAPDAPKDPRFATPAARLQHRAASDELVGSWIARHDQADVEARFAAAGVAGTAVRSADDIIADAHVKAREAMLHLTSATGREFLAPAPVPRLSRTPAGNARRAPTLGEHTAAVRSGIERIEARTRVDAPDDPAPAGATPSWGPLRGVRVLDLSQWLAGPAAAALLGDFGADVIMVELPSVAADAQGRRSPGFVVTNRNKRSVTLDVRAPRGREAFLELVRVSDVIVENFRPGTLERWDLAPATLLAANPRLVLLRSSGFGQSGPYTGRAAFNPVGLAFGGITYLNGWPDRPPLRDGVMGGDYSTALFNVLGMMAALLRRDADGQGQVVDTAMFQAALRLTGDLLAVRSALGIRRERAGGDSPLYPASLTVEAADGRFVATSASSWHDVSVALAQLGRRPPDDPASVREDVAKLVGALPAAEAVTTLRGAGLAASAVNSVADLVREPHCWSRGDLVRLAHPEMGEIVTQGIVPALSRTPGRVAGWSPRPGSDNEAVFGGLLGYPAERIQEIG
jgi:crotonobetainyl-CoA:carnitine CoA-transferase CaiB-like acyl-CoA transferase